MMTYALDTNIISFLLKESPAVVSNVRDALSSQNKLVIPPIVYYEVRRGLLSKDTPVLTPSFNRFCQKVPIVQIKQDTLEVAAKIYATLKKAGQLIDDADILIAASCLVHDYTLVTDNTRHFNRVEGLKIVNWAE